MRDSFVRLWHLGRFIEAQSRIYYPIASLWLCQTIQHMRDSGVPPGLVQGSAAVPKMAVGSRPSLLRSPQNSRGATDSFNDTVGVAACLRLILPTWLKFAVGSFSSVLSRQKGPFRRCLCAGVHACAPCAVFAHVRLQSWRDARERGKKNPFPVIIPAVLESYVLEDDEFCMCSSQVSSASVYCVPYIHTHDRRLMICDWSSTNASLGQCAIKAGFRAWNDVLVGNFNYKQAPRTVLKALLGRSRVAMDNGW